MRRQVSAGAATRWVIEMVRGAKRHWGPADREAFILAVGSIRHSIITLMSRCPIGTPEYRALSELMDAVNAAGAFLDLRWTRPGGNQFPG